ncbi:MAG: hypothetical protein KF901_19040 [Myxococcales bacterium]|nr:hypothetical protein [Myxococcales bacterium]
MNPDSLFDRLDRWRKLPTYQLERRADVFFALYLREVLQTHLGVALDERLIPELPLRRHVLDDSHPDDGLSWKADYAACSRDRSLVFLVELKTDSGSNRTLQDTFLERASDVGLAPLLEGIVEIASRSSSRKKYLALLRELEALGWIALPEGIHGHDGKSRGWKSALRDVRVLSNAPIEIVYVQPHAHLGGKRTIDFASFATVVERHGDPWSLRFAHSLREWGERGV